MHKDAHRNNYLENENNTLFGNNFQSTNWITAVKAYHNSDLLASGSDDGYIRLWAYSNVKNSLEERFKIPIVC